MNNKKDYLPESFEQAKECYCWKGLNTSKFQVLEIIALSEYEAAILMKDTASYSPMPYCVEYQFSGKYFQTIEEMEGYVSLRQFRKNALRIYRYTDGNN